MIPTCCGDELGEPPIPVGTAETGAHGMSQRLADLVDRWCCSHRAMLADHRARVHASRYHLDR